MTVNSVVCIIQFALVICVARRRGRAAGFCSRFKGANNRSTKYIDYCNNRYNIL